MFSLCVLHAIDSIGLVIIQENTCCLFQVKNNRVHKNIVDNKLVFTLLVCFKKI